MQLYELAPENNDSRGNIKDQGNGNDLIFNFEKVNISQWSPDIPLLILIFVLYLQDLQNSCPNKQLKQLQKQFVFTHISMSIGAVA